MIITLKNSSGDYLPLDVFEDFEIRYNHQYEDYKTIGSKKIPYTNTFKIPTTNNNRNLTGLPFDLAYPISHSVDGKMLFNDGTVAFEFIADIEGQTTNVLEPFIEISIIDKISKALSDMSKYKLSEMMAGETFNLSSDTWMFGDQTGLTTPEKYWLFIYLNYNNRNALISHDPMRGLNQLHPTFILNKLVDKMFAFAGLTVESDFLNLDDQLATGIKANELGITIPWRMKTFSDVAISTEHYFSGAGGALTTNERVDGVPSQMPTTSRLAIENFIKNGTYVNMPLKFNYDFMAAYTYNGTAYPDNYAPRYCSVVDGKMSVRVQSNNTAVKPKVLFGRMWNIDSLGLANYTYVTSVSGTPPDMDVKLVDADMERKYYGGFLFSQSSWWEQADSYDVKNSPVVGKAVYTGINSETFQMEWEIQLDADTTVELDVKANQSLGLAYIVVPPNNDSEYIVDYHMTDSYEGGDYTMQMILKEGYLEYRMISNVGGTHDGQYYNTQSVTYSKPSGVDIYPANLTFSFKEATDIPTGNLRYSPVGSPTGGMITYPDYVSNSVVDMEESMSSVKDYTMLEILKMIMERFNLQFYSTSDGVIHLDTKENRSSGANIIIDYLIDEDMVGVFTNNQNGLLSIKDTNASFYEDDFNVLDKYSISDVKREEVALSFASGIVNDKMFEDVYDDSAYDLLAWRGDSNSWGTSDREQKEPTAFKPTFCFIQPNVTPIFMPLNKCNYSLYIQDDGGDTWEEEGLDIGFYNEFFNSQPLNVSLKATNTHSTGFELVSFYDNDFVLGDTNLFKQTWYQDVMSNMNDDAVNITFDIYLSESNMKILKDFPNIIYKGEEYIIEGFNDYPLSAQNGGLTKITIIKKKIWN